MRPERHLGAVVSGVVFIVLGVLFMLELLGLMEVEGRFIWPILLIAIGAAVMLGARRRTVEHAPPPPEAPDERKDEP